MNRYQLYKMKAKRMGYAMPDRHEYFAGLDRQAAGLARAAYDAGPTVTLSGLIRAATGLSAGSATPLRLQVLLAELRKAGALVEDNNGNLTAHPSKWFLHIAKHRRANTITQATGVARDLGFTYTQAQIRKYLTADTDSN